jgi:ech hydrogenase subunit B
MIKWTDLILILISIPASALAGGLIQCVEEFAGALVSARRPHYFFRPFADFFSRLKIAGSESNRFQFYSATLHLLFTAIACMILFTGDDLLLAILALLAANAILIAGAAGLNSPYARMGAKHESYKFALYGAVLIIFAICVKQITGTLLIADILKYTMPLLYRLPLVFILIAAVPAVLFGKSPFNFSGAMKIEFIGSQTSVLALAGWYERTFLYGLIFMFGAGNAFGGFALIFAVFAVQITADRFLGDFRPGVFLKWGAVAILFLAMINLLWIFLGGVIT